MPSLPSKTTLNGTSVPAPSTTVFKAAMGQLYDYLSGLLGIDGSVNTARYALQAADIKGLNITATVLTNALTITLQPQVLEFRQAALADGTSALVNLAAAINLVVPNGASLGTANATSARLAVLAINNGGTVELAVVNTASNPQLDETNLVSTTAISAAATSASVIYSGTARNNLAYRVVGFIDITEAVAGAWASAPSLVQAVGGLVGNSLNKASTQSFVSSFGMAGNTAMIPSHWGSYFYNVSSSNYTFLLDNTAGNTKKTVTLSCLGTGTITINVPSGGIYANGVSALSSLVLTQGQSITLMFDGSNYLQSSYSVQSVGIGQTWQDVTASRASGTIYTNTTGKPIAVMISGTTTASGQGVSSFTVNGTTIFNGNTSTQASASAFKSGSGAFIVPAGATYSATFSFNTGTLWAELR